MEFGPWLWTREQLERLPTEELDRMAFGFVSGDTLTLHPKQIVVTSQDDMENVYYQIQRHGNEKAWAKSVSLRKPIDVHLRNGRYELNGGHHRWYAALLTNRKLKAVVTIQDSAITAILKARQL